MPKAGQQRRPSLDLAGRQASSPDTNGSTSPLPKGTERQQAQSLTPANAELILTVLREVRRGNFSVRMPVDLVGTDGKIADALNDILERKFLNRRHE